ncbi:alpha-L-rhamnosidase C-terminal domain-containing protein [Robiginitalea sp. M366]|uniref:alpha-L-rhamnosidase-related protein n=1 Tax=Robiginitalea aestuariiviva TaxID=3036903 RepID=UPI00240DF26C|nr:alpha-L-rhamnosidase C-terminal domain-containing protein [Robiginitalea aestuariiviva]MDG1573349.1 alpha-L-rhamnosidase C-terminal domain-containing protein [Robiginitalea aestuariiviva]
MKSLPMPFRLLAVALLTFGWAFSQGQEPDPRSPWEARWIAHPDDPGDTFGVFHFRKVLELDQAPEHFVVHLSADNRYKLYVNGQYLTFGPARGDRLQWRYETLDLAPYLRQGTNILAATVWNFAEYRPVAQHTVRTGFILQGAPETRGLANTNASWEVLANPAYTPLPVRLNAYYVVGPGEGIAASDYPWGWMDPANHTPGFVAARELQAGRPQASLGRYGGTPSHVLVPRTLPLMEEKAQEFAAVPRRNPNALGGPDYRGEKALTIPANRKVTLLFDQGHLTNAYPIVTTRGGKGARLSLTYAESLVDSAGNKGNRNAVAGKHIVGNTDRITLDGGASRTFETLWWRTFRFVEMEIQTGGEPLVLERFYSRFTGYPLEEAAVFEAAIPGLEDLWEVGWRTQRLCAGENYFDCPYYEQLQYAGDTRIQALITTYVSGDTRLFKNALLAYRDSKRPFGLTQSRYPSYDPQQIPTFSLVWITMLHDYWMHTPDTQTVSELVPEILSVLEWYEARLREDGLLGPMEWWNFVDWVVRDGWESGIPPGAETGGSALITLQYAYTLQKAIPLLQAFGYPGQAERFTSRVASLQQAVQQTCWDPVRGLYADTPAKDFYSQHTNTLAVLTGTVPQEAAAPLMERVLEGQDQAETSYYFSFYRTEALLQAGMGNRYLGTLGPWHTMLANGLTTFAEEPEPTRSDCHAWSASPLYHFLSLMLGIRPDSPGFETVGVSPHFNGLDRLDGRMPHPKGEVEVALRQTARGGLEGTITLPEGTPGTLYWQGQELALTPGENRIRIRP